MMNRQRLLLCLFCAAVSFAQDSIQGIVVNDLGNPLAEVTILAQPANSTTTTDETGYFSLTAVAPQTLFFSLQGHLPYQLQAAPGDLLTVALLPEGTDVVRAPQTQRNVITLSDEELSDDNDTLDNISGLLQTAEDVFSRTAAFEFSASFFRLRGLDSNHATVMINGLPMNKLHSGRPQWSNWGGLNDVLRHRELSSSIVPSQILLGGALGTTNMITRASGYSRGGRLTFSFSNRSYNQRIMASYATGLMPNGWSAAVAVGNRWGQAGFQNGTFYDAQSLFVAVEKEWAQHSLNLTLMATPNRRGKSSPNTQEVYDLKGIRYNEYWGHQSGEVRNSRVKRVFEPIIMLHHEWKLSERSSLSTNIGLQFGAQGNSRLDYPGGANPSPTYYQKLPSYFLSQRTGPDYENAYLYQQAFEADGQLNWNKIYDANATNNISGLPAAYVLYEDRTDDVQWSANTNFRTRWNEKISMTSTLQHRFLRSENYASVLDLMGSTAYLNVDPYTGIQFDYDNPNRLVGVGDKMRYHYDMHAQQTEVNSIVHFSFSKLSGYMGVGYHSTQYQRNGKYRYEASLEHSKGKSKKIALRGENIKLGTSYMFTGKHGLQLNAALLSRAPSIRNSFSNPRHSNAIVGEQAGRPLALERITTTDISYVFRAPKLKARLTGFYTKVHDANELSFFFAEGLGGDTSSFVQEVMHDIDRQHQGVEFGIEGQLFHSFTLKAAAAMGQYTYANNPQVYLTSDDFGYLDFGTTKMKHLRLASGPQEAYSLGVEFRENFWWFALTGNYFDKTFLDVSPINRTQNFLLDRDGLPFLDYDPEQARMLLQQEQFDSYVVVNMVVGKSWRVGEQYVGAFLSVNNLLNQSYKTGGFEQSRNANYRELLEEVQAEKRRFGPKYWYGRGTTYFLNMYMRF